MSAYIRPCLVAAVLLFLLSDTFAYTANSRLGPLDVVRSARRRRQAQTLTPRQKSDIVDHHNELRSREGADNMEHMTWNNFLATTAARWAAVCKWEHGQADLGANPEYGSMGQNLYATTGRTLRVKHAINSWYNEKSDYTYETMQCVAGKMCGHYTQVVWAASREVGCAYHRCKQLTGVGFNNAVYFVCNYGPAGNFHGEKPYTKGPPCTKCGSGAGWCKDKLCCSGKGRGCSCAALCRNCAKLNQETCRCSCAKGWHGPDCSFRCEDTNANCNANPGWPPFWCDKPFVKDACPAMCDLCTPDPNAKPGLCKPVGNGSRGDFERKEAETSSGSAKAKSVNSQLTFVIVMLAVVISNSALL